ncbi:hypothetical protein N8Z24_00310 [bacterium]|nr:hypothetical protein [bacterium]
MTEVKYNNNKYICGEDDFKITNGDDSEDNYVSLAHDEVNAVREIGYGSEIVNHSLPLSMSDDGYFDLPAESAGYGFFLVGDGEEYAEVYWSTDNTVTLIDNSTNVAVTDSDTDFCIFDNTTSIRVRNRLGTAKNVVFDYSYTELPVAPTFQAFSVLSGIDNLDPKLTINGTTVTPTFRYKGGDADATDWNYWGYGEDLDLESGTVPTYNDGSPGLGASDDSVKFNTGGFYRYDTDTTFGDITTEDIVFEVVIESGLDGVKSYFSSKRYGGGAYPGWALYWDTNDRFYLDLDVGATTVQLSTASLLPQTWYHILFFINRSDATHGGATYVNGISSGATADVTAVAASLTNIGNFAIGDKNYVGEPYSTRLTYLAAWLEDDWHQAGALGPAEWATVAAERFAKFSGIYPQVFNNPDVIVDGDMEAVGTAAWTASDSTLGKDTTVPLYEGAQHLRITSTGSTFWAIQSTILTAGQKYNVTGAARSVSGSAIPNIYEGTPVLRWTGTTSTSWQEFDITFTATGSSFLIGSASASGVVDFDAVTVTRIEGLATTAERTYPAYIDKIEEGYSKLYYVGSEWLRMCHRQDSAGENVYGYLSETAAENLALYSEDYSNWTVIDSGPDIITDNATVCPDGRTVAASIAASTSNADHGVRQYITLTAETYSFSVFVKSADKDWVALENKTVANCICYFNVTNGTIGTAGAGATGYIEGPFYNDFYRVCIVFTGTVDSHNMRIVAAEDDNDQEFSGNGSTVDLYVWGAQCELNVGGYMTSPVITSAGSETRVMDELRYDAKDNIGGEDNATGTVAWDILLSDYEMTSPVIQYCYSISDAGASGDRVAGYIVADELFYTLSRASGGNNGDVVVNPGDCSDGVKHSLRSTWATDDLTLYRDGVQGTTDTSADMPDDLDRLSIGSARASTNQFNGLIQNFRIYNAPTTKG